MSLDSNNVRVAVTGAIYVGATTATAPTAAHSALVGFTNLGFVNGDGVKENTDRTVTAIKGWQNGATLRTIVSEAEYAVKFTLSETNLEVLKLYYGTDVVDGVATIDPSSTGGRKSFVIDAIDGAVVERTYIPRGEVTAVGERALSGSQEMAYDITITAYADASGSTHTKFFSQFEA